MKRRTTSSNNAPHDGWGDRPVETTSHKAISPTTEVKIPRSQSFWVALPLSVAVIVSFTAPVLIGARIFYAVTGIAAFAAFLWSLAYELEWQDRVSLPFVLGLVAWCFWRFSSFIGWNIPESWQPYPALIATGALVFWWTFTAAMWLTMLQRLGMPMEHQQYSVWKAIGNLLEHYGKRERPQVQEVDVDPPMPFEFSEEGRQGWRNSTSPQPRSVMVWVARILTEQTFSEANLCGTDKPLPGGKRGREQLDELRQWMINEGLLAWRQTNGGGDPVPTGGVDLTSNGQRWVDKVAKVRVEE